MVQNVVSSRRLGILVPLDGSASAERALRWAETLAEAAHLEIVLLRAVLPPRAAVLLAPMVGQADDSGSDRRELCDEYLRSLSINLREKGVETRYETPGLDVLDESVAELRAHFTRENGNMILERADQDDIDMVIMASHGMTSQPSVKWGSVTRYVHSQVRKPILMVPVR